MWQRIIQGWQEGFGLEKNFFRWWLFNLAFFIFIGVFILLEESEVSTYYSSAVLVVVNSLILFLLTKDLPKIKLAMSVFLFVFNAVLFGYYYFSSITIFF